MVNIRIYRFLLLLFEIKIFFYLRFTFFPMSQMGQEDFLIIPLKFDKYYLVFLCLRDFCNLISSEYLLHLQMCYVQKILLLFNNNLTNFYIAIIWMVAFLTNKGRSMFIEESSLVLSSQNMDLKLATTWNGTYTFYTLYIGYLDN